ncbi:DUF1887 family CARF protein [Thermodesulfovibrio sp.]|uniref:Card1-like endonuclease domain-containing protein n=1 Tax=Thermodesulfovibrio sp. TaxID=2067987 RepID=UPI00309601C4
MSHLHICLVSDQPIPNLTTILQFKPDKVVLLKTKDMEEKSELLEEVIKKKNFDVSSEIIEAYDINNVMKISDSLIKRYKNYKVSLNITGGTKIGTIGTFLSFYTSGNPIYYVDTKNNKILQLFPENEQKEIPIEASISISDYLTSYGFKIESFVENDSYIHSRKELTNYLANTIITNPEIIPKINSSMHKYNEESSLPISLKLPNDEKFSNLINQLDGVKQKDKNKIEINDYKSLKYLKGFWFEEYVYMVAKSLNPDEIKLNVKGKWHTKSKHQPKNEFDIMLSKKNKLFLISCKTSYPDRKVGDETVSKEYIYELVSLSDKALGLFGKRMLISARTINDNFVKERARILKVDIIDGKSIVNLKENLRKWLQ